MMTPEENDLLCRVEGDAPMGQIMRRHWIAACLSEEVAEPDGAPVEVRLLGEDLVVFRDSKGRARRAGRILLAPARVAGVCAQRGVRTALPLSRLEIRRRRQRGRDGIGARAAASSRNASSTRPIRRARPAASCGPIWARPVRCANSSRRPSRRRRTRALAPPRSSALQLGADPRRPDRLGAFVEPAFLRHGAGAGRWRQGDGRQLAAPFDRQGAALPDRATSYGFRYAAIRRPIKNEATHDYIRTTVYIAPFTALIPPNNVHNVATLLTPEDDHNTIFYFIAWNDADKPGIDAGRLAQVQRAAMGHRRRPRISTACARATISTVRIARR